MIPQYSGQECRTLVFHVIDSCFKFGAAGGSWAGRWFCFVGIGLRVFAPLFVRGEPSKTLSLFDGGRGNYFTDAERAWTFVLSTLDAFIAAPVFLGRNFVLLLMFDVHFGFAP